MCTHSGTVTVPPSRSAIITSSCAPKEAGGERAASLGSDADTRPRPYQLLSLCLEGCIDPDNERRGCAKDFQQLRRQDGHISEAATGPEDTVSSREYRVDGGRARQKSTCI